MTVKLQKNYIAELLADVPISSTWEIWISLSIELESDQWFIVIDRGVDQKEESMFYHRKQQNTVYVYSINRDTPRFHAAWAKVIQDSISTINYLSDNTFKQNYIFKSSPTNAIIKWGNFYINSQNQYLSDLATDWLLVNWEANIVYIDETNYQYIISTSIQNKYKVWIINVDSFWNISSIEQSNTMNISWWLTDAERDKLNWLNSADYEKIVNKTSSIRSVNSSDDTKYPTEKAVAIWLNNKVDKVSGKWLSDNNFTDTYKNKINQLNSLNLWNVNFNDIHPLRNDEIRVEASASTSVAISEKELRKEFDKYVRKDGSKVLSTNDFTNQYKNKVDELAQEDFDDYFKKVNIKQSISIVWATNKIPSERAIRNTLNNYVRKDGNKVLSTNDFTDEYKDKVDNIQAQWWAITIQWWRWINVHRTWNTYNINSHIDTHTDNTSSYINIFPYGNSSYSIDYNEERYIVLTDTVRTSFTWTTQFKNWSQPIIKVYYNNLNSAGDILIDTLIKVIDANWIEVESHKSIPYSVSISQWNWVFELWADSFQWLTYTNSSLIKIIVSRVWNRTTDQDNSVLNDLDTLNWDLLIKWASIEYSTLLSWHSLFNWELFDGQCEPIATVTNWLITEVNKTALTSWANSSWIKWIVSSIMVDNGIINRTLDWTSYNETDLMNLLYTYIEDLKTLNIFTYTEHALNWFSISNLVEDKTYDSNNTQVNELADVLWTLITKLSWLPLYNKCNVQVLTPQDNWINVTYNISNYNQLRTIDVNTASLHNYRDFILTLINDSINANLFNWWVIQKINHTYLVENANKILYINNQVNNLNQIWNFLRWLIWEISKELTI